MARGVLIAESLRPGAAIERLGFAVTRVRRVATSSSTDPVWTLLDFTIPDAAAPGLADSLAGALDPGGAWYCDFRSEANIWVVFPGHPCSYARGDQAGHAQAVAVARSLGIPEEQLDWPQ